MVEKRSSSTLSTAQRMIDRFGDRAIAECEQRWYELLEHGEDDAAAQWKQVIDILKKMKLASPSRN